MAPEELASPFQSLPPILHRSFPSPLPSCSKGARGLSVLPRVDGIRAGRNLPDKEFRYLRTVIVTAAVYRGFSLELWSEDLTPPLNLPAPGRRHTLYIILRFSRVLCFC